MKTMRLHVFFSEDLTFFLPGGCAFDDCDISRRASVKDIIESFGVPHTEVGHIRFNGAAVGFDFVPEHPGRIRIAGIDAPFDVTAGDALRPSPLPSVKFIADMNVIKLGRYLILLGYDTRLARVESDAAIADLACTEERIVLTRDTRLLYRKKIAFARRVRSGHPLDQLGETLGFFGLEPDPGAFFSRCSRCNIRLAAVEKSEVLHLLEPKTRLYVHTFRRCPACGQVFWEGSHQKALLERFRAKGLLPLISFPRLV